MATAKLIPFNSVKRKGKNNEETHWSFKHWADLIEANFEKEFHVVAEMGELVNKTGIYKDSVGATQKWADFQLRCNFPITMVVVSIFLFDLFL